MDVLTDDIYLEIFTFIKLTENVSLRIISKRFSRIINLNFIDRLLKLQYHYDTSSGIMACARMVANPLSLKFNGMSSYNMKNGIIAIRIYSDDHIIILNPYHPNLIEMNGRIIDVTSKYIIYSTDLYILNIMNDECKLIYKSNTTQTTKFKPLDDLTLIGNDVCNVLGNYTFYKLHIEDDIGNILVTNTEEILYRKCGKWMFQIDGNFYYDEILNKINLQNECVFNIWECDSAIVILSYSNLLFYKLSDMSLMYKIDTADKKMLPVRRIIGNIVIQNSEIISDVIGVIEIRKNIYDVGCNNGDIFRVDFNDINIWMDPSITKIHEFKEKCFKISKFGPERLVVCFGNNIIIVSN